MYNEGDGSRGRKVPRDLKGWKTPRATGGNCCMRAACERVALHGRGKRRVREHVDRACEQLGARARARRYVSRLLTLLTRRTLAPPNRSDNYYGARSEKSQARIAELTLWLTHTTKEMGDLMPSGFDGRAARARTRPRKPRTAPTTICRARIPSPRTRAATTSNATRCAHKWPTPPTQMCLPSAHEDQVYEWYVKDMKNRGLSTYSEPNFTS